MRPADQVQVPRQSWDGESPPDRMLFSHVYRDLYTSCHALATRILQDRHLAEDAVQDAFETLWTAPHRYDPDIGPLAPWLLTVVRRRAIDTVRRTERRRQVESQIDLQDRPGGDAADLTLDLLDAQVVTRALDRLPEAQRRVLVLLYWEGMSHAQVAAALGAPLGTVKTRARDGVVRLRRLLHGSC